jgi:hypothetical protein
MKGENEMKTQGEKRAEYRSLKNQHRLSGTIRSAMAKRTQREELAGRVKFAQFAQKKKPRLLPLGETSVDVANTIARKQRPRVERWVSPEPSARKGLGFQIIERDEGSYSSRCRYRKIDYVPMVECYIRAFGSRLFARIANFAGGSVVYRHRVPQGYFFGTDALGVYCARKNETRENYRYHLTSDDVSAPNFKSTLRSTIIAHEKKQIKERK